MKKEYLTVIFMIHFYAIESRFTSVRRVFDLASLLWTVCPLHALYVVVLVPLSYSFIHTHGQGCGSVFFFSSARFGFDTFRLEQVQHKRIKVHISHQCLLKNEYIWVLIYELCSYTVSIAGPRFKCVRSAQKKIVTPFPEMIPILNSDRRSCLARIYLGSNGTVNIPYICHCRQRPFQIEGLYYMSKKSKIHCIQ